MPALPQLQNLNSVLHEKSRLAIVSFLAAADSVTFRELKESLAMTDGNLSVHLRVLEESGYIEIEKSFVGRKPQTRVSLNRQGRKALEQYVDHLEAIVRQVRGR